MPEIPSFKCKTGCGKCCTTTPVSLKEIVAIAQYTGKPAQVVEIDVVIAGRKTRAIHTNITEQGDCVYLGPFRECTIHPVRPIMCRLFGNVDIPMLTCPEGCGPVKKLSNAQAEKIMLEEDALTAITEIFDR